MRRGHELLSIPDRSKYDGLSHHISQLNNHHNFEYCQLDISAKHSVRWIGDSVLHIRRPAKRQSRQPTVYCECVNATLFAIDSSTPFNRPVTYDQTIISPTTLYDSNVTLVNGVFTRDQPLILLFTIVNPDLSKPYNATVTIEHEWPGPQAHGMSVTFSLNPGDRLSDLPFNATGPQTYKATILFTGTGVQVTLTNLRTFSNSMNGTMTPGTSPVVPNRPHAGLFNIILTSILNNNPQTPTNSILSPLYAYVPSS